MVIFGIVSVWELIPSIKPQPSNFFCPPGTEEPNKSAPGRLQTRTYASHV